MSATGLLGLGPHSQWSLQPLPRDLPHSDCACPQGALGGRPGAPAPRAGLCVRKEEILLWVFPEGFSGSEGPGNRRERVRRVPGTSLLPTCPPCQG